ncbi:MAG: PAS domain-containing sensor histidine kinase [Candidatus Heimdallarchaeaceae archaeon]
MKKITSSDRESEEFLRLIFEQTFLGLVLLQDDQVKYTNQATAEMFDTTIEEIYKWNTQGILEAIDKEDRDFVSEQLMKKQKGETDVVDSHSFKVNTSEGPKYINLFSKTVIFNGKTADLVSIIDITDQTLAKLELKESEDKFKLLFNNTNDSIFMIQVDEEGNMLKFVEVNDTTCTWLGLKREELLNLSPENLLPPDLKEKGKEAIQWILKFGFLTYEIEILLIDGNRLPVEMSSSLFSDGEKKYVLSSAREIGDRVVARKLRESQIEEKTLLLDIITHDLRNYLARIWACVEYSSSNEEGTLGEIRNQASKSKSSLLQIDNLIDNISVLMKRDLGRDYELKPVALLKVINKCIRDLKDIYPNKSFKFNMENITKEQTILADTLFDQLIINILTNSVKNDPADKIIIDFSLTEEEDYTYRLKISDHGEGIDPDKRQDIFERYSEFRKTGKGSGLGLFIIKTLVERYKGQIKIENTIEEDYTKGTTFSLLLKKAT